MRTRDRYLIQAAGQGDGSVIVGAVSGTVLSFELGLLWPSFMGTFGEAIGLPFALEGFAFFTEAIFLGIYLYGRGRVSERFHLLSGVAVAASGAASAFFVTLVNAFMNDPAGIVETRGGALTFEPSRPCSARHGPPVRARPRVVLPGDGVGHGGDSRVLPAARSAAGAAPQGAGHRAAPGVRRGDRPADLGRSLGQAPRARAADEAGGRRGLAAHDARRAAARGRLARPGDGRIPRRAGDPRRPLAAGPQRRAFDRDRWIRRRGRTGAGRADARPSGDGGDRDGHGVRGPSRRPSWRSSGGGATRGPGRALLGALVAVGPLGSGPGGLARRRGVPAADRNTCTAGPSRRSCRAAPFWLFTIVYLFLGAAVACLLARQSSPSTARAARAADLRTAGAAFVALCLISCWPARTSRRRVWDLLAFGPRRAPAPRRRAIGPSGRPTTSG